MSGEKEPHTMEHLVRMPPQGISGSLCGWLKEAPGLHLARGLKGYFHEDVGGRLGGVLAVTAKSWQRLRGALSSRNFSQEFLSRG